MPNDRSQNRKPLYGALILLGLIGFAVLIFVLQPLLHSTARSIELIALLPEATALDAETPVWVAGKQVGTVKSIRFRGTETDSATRMAVALQVSRKFSEQIRADAHVRVTTAHLIGAPVIEIDPGTPSAPAIHNLDTLRVSRSGTLEGVMDKAAALTIDFDRLIVDMSKVSRGAKGGSARMARLQANLAAVTTEFRTFTKSWSNSPARSASAEVQAALQGLSARNSELREALNQAMTRARSTRADVEPALRQLMARSDTISGVIRDLRSRVTESGGGLLLRAQKDSAITKALHEATVQLDSLMAITKRNPLRFWF